MRALSPTLVLGQDLGQAPGEFVGAGEVGVQGEAGGDALHGRRRGAAVGAVPPQPVGVGCQHEQPLGAGAHQG
ncbi:hypothetical protein TPA0906_12780 [Streptomyces olivaceus]|nr:hypothetical protein TPA0906_12780 [Streptomyces olivaceus]